MIPARIGDGPAVFDLGLLRRTGGAALTAPHGNGHGPAGLAGHGPDVEGGRTVRGARGAGGRRHRHRRVVIIPTRRRTMTTIDGGRLGSLGDVLIPIADADDVGISTGSQTTRLRDLDQQFALGSSDGGGGGGGRMGGGGGGIGGSDGGRRGVDGHRRRHRRHGGGDGSVGSLGVDDDDRLRGPDRDDERRGRRSKMVDAGGGDDGDPAGMTLVGRGPRRVRRGVLLSGPSQRALG